MIRKKFSLPIIFIVVVLSLSFIAAAPDPKVGANILLNTAITDDILAELGGFGKVNDLIVEINAITMRTTLSQLPAIEALPYVDFVGTDAERKGAPIDTVLVEDFSVGLSTWNLDVINITYGPGFTTRAVAEDGSGVFVAVLDTGLVSLWRSYFPEERIAMEYGIAFGGGGGDQGTVSTQPDKWQHDTNSHGTHVTSTIIGYSFQGTPVTGVAPMATIIPVKVLNQNGSGWSSVIARGILYVAELKEGPLADYPVVINMSLGGPGMDTVEKAAIDYAINAGVIIVASAGNEGELGMGYPGAYAPVISVASAGWVYEWAVGPWWYALDVVDPNNPAEFYISDFSSWAYPGQDLDLSAPGSWIVGPYNTNLGQLMYYFLGGTSMASPHVAGTVALMAQKYPALTASQAESILEGSVFVLPISAQLTGAGLLDAAAALNATP
jgi:subtilisin family serine protease